jgi:hypothetical protein
MKIDILDKLKVVVKLLNAEDESRYEINPDVISEAIGEIEKLRVGSNWAIREIERLRNSK